MSDENDFGLDKSRRLEAEREKEREDDIPEPLDPEWPYWVIALDLNDL